MNFSASPISILSFNFFFSQCDKYEMSCPLSFNDVHTRFNTKPAGMLLLFDDFST